VKRFRFRKEDNKKLTPKQISEWRRILVGQIGIYALILSEEKIQKIHDKYPGVVK